MKSRIQIQVDFLVRANNWYICFSKLNINKNSNVAKAARDTCVFCIIHLVERSLVAQRLKYYMVIEDII